MKTDGYDLENIDEKLRIWKEDVVKTECPIVIAGQSTFFIMILVLLSMCNKLRTYFMENMDEKVQSRNLL